LLDERTRVYLPKALNWFEKTLGNIMKSKPKSKSTLREADESSCHESVISPFQLDAPSFGIGVVSVLCAMEAAMAETGYSVEQIEETKKQARESVNSQLQDYFGDGKLRQP